MEFGFDFSQIKWVVIFVLFVAYKFFSAKPKVDSYPEEGEQTEGQSVGDLLKEMMGQQNETMSSRDLESRANEILEKQRAIKSSSKAKKVAQTPKPKVENEEVNVIENTPSEIENIAEEFDLKKAVIMSEILNRKYED